MTSMRLIAAALTAAFTLAAGAAQAQVRTQWIEYAHGDTKLKGYLAHDDKIKGKRPAILMIHDRAGMQPYAQKQAEHWASLGYVTFAADFFGYGQGILPKDVPEATAQMGIYTKDRALLKARAQAGYDALIKNPMVDPSRVALIGYCFGGLVGVEFGSTGVPLRRKRRDPRLVLRPSGGMGQDGQGQIPDPARRGGRAVPARKGRAGLQRAPQGQGRLPDGIL